MSHASAARRLTHRVFWILSAMVAVESQSFLTRSATAAPCGPIAEVHGDRQVVDIVVAALEDRGIGTYPSVDCRVVHARVRQRHDGMVVTILDADGRASERMVNGPAAAATLIESWVRSDVVSTLLAAHHRRSNSVDEEDPLQRNHTPDTALSVTSRSPGDKAASALSFTANGELSVATDSSLWIGLSVALCFRIGPVCAGALARVSRDSGLSGDSEDTSTGRLATDVLLGAGLPVRLERWTLTPGIAVGVGWMRTKALSSSVGGDTDVDSGGLRASASLRTSFDISQTVAVDLIVGADVAPVAHTDAYNVQDATLAGEPRGYLRCGLGIRIGGQ